MASTRGLRLAAAIYTLAAALLFATSAVYHRGSWSRRHDAVLRRLDHANIFLIIAGSYTPFAVLLPRGPATILLTIVWAGALVAVLFRILRMDAPRWVYVPSYAALGLVAVFFVPLMRDHLGVPTLTLVVVGGVRYILGAVVYGLRRPDPLTALVRISRDLPDVDDPGVPDPLRGRLARPLLTRRAQLRTHARHRPRPCPVAARARQGGAAVHRGSTPRTGPHRPPRA